jgi:hypothetical protein
MESLKMDSKMETVFILGNLVRNIKDIGKMEIKVVVELNNILMEIFIMDSGKIINGMGMEH